MSILNLPKKSKKNTGRSSLGIPVLFALIFASIGFTAVYYMRSDKPILIHSISDLVESGITHIARLHCEPVYRYRDTKRDDWPVCGIIGYRDRTLKTVENQSGVAYSSSDTILYLSPDQVDSNKPIELTGYDLFSDLEPALKAWLDGYTLLDDDTLSERKLYVDELSRDSLPYKALESNLRRSSIAPRSWFGEAYHPVYDTPAYISKEFLVLSSQYQFSTSVNKQIVKVAHHSSAIHPYEPVGLNVPSTLEEYSDGFYEAIDAPLIRECGNRFAILLHEPHRDVNQEAGLFYFLHHLQNNNPGLFDDLHIFQEGQPNSLGTSVTGEQPETKSKLVAESYYSWSSKYFDELRSLEVSRPNESYKAVKRFLSLNNLGSDSPHQTLRTALEFYSFEAPGGYLDLKVALEKHVEAKSEKEDTSAFSNRLQSLHRQDANFSQHLIQNLGMRGAFAYQLYQNGYAGGRGSKKVFVHGLDDIGLYMASCALYSDCLNNTGSLSDWKNIQPYRDHVMAEIVERSLQDLPKETIPVVAASVSTHLPLVQDRFCEHGISSVALKFYETWAWAPHDLWGATTGLMGFFNGNLRNAGLPVARVLSGPSGGNLSSLLDRFLH